jgi:translocation and assembly module TamB
MTNAPTPGNEPEPTSENPSQQPSSPPVRRRLWRRVAIVVSIVLLSGAGGGLTWLWFFVYRQLGPQVETSVTKLLDRPIKLGSVERFSLNGLRFGASSLPATANNPDRATTEAVEVTFNLLPLLIDRTLPLEVTLVKPKVYIEQDKQGRWVELNIQKQPKGALDIKLEVLKLRDAEVALVPRGAAGNSRKPVALSLSSGKARFLNENKLIKFEVGGQLVAGGNLTVTGDSLPATGEIKAAILGNDLSAPEVGRIIQLPLILKSGAIDGNLEVTSIPKKPLTFLGTAGLKNVTAQLDPLPQSFANTTGQLRFKGTQVRLDGVNSLFGQIPAVANGTVDTQEGFNLSAQTQAVQLPQVLQTFKIKTLPVPVAATVKADLQVTGTPSKPVLSGKFTTTKAAQIDKVKFRSIASDFGVVGSTLSVSNLRALPTLGGLVTGNGEVQLGQKGGGVTFNLQGNNLPADAIALTYDFKPPVPLGLISGRTQIVGSLNNPDNIRATGSANLNLAGGAVAVRNIQVAGKRFTAQVQASDVQVGRLAEVPPQFRVPVSGNFTVSGPLTNITVATIQGTGSGSLNAAGGNIRATNIQLANGRFTAQVQASGVQVGRLAEVPPQFRVPVSGNFTLSGPLTDFTTAKVQGSGSGSLNVAGGSVRATNIQLADGRFSARVQASGVQVERVAQVPPQIRGPLSGNFTLSGPLTDLTTAKIQGIGSGTLNIAGGTVTATNVKLANNRFTAQVRASGVPVQRLAQVPPQVRGPLSGNFNLSGPLTDFTIAKVQGSGSGTLNVAGGTVTATNVQLANNRFAAQVQTSGVQVQRLAQVPPQFRGALSGNFNFAGALDNVSPSTIQGSGSGTLNVAAGGTVKATNFQLADGRFQAVVEPTGVQLASFSQDLRGRLSGKLDVSGLVSALSPAAIQANGQVNFSEGLAIIDRPLTAAINWNGQQLQIQQASADGFNASGVVDVNLANQGLQAIRSFNLNVQAKDLDLQELPVTLPNAVNVAGRADFDGTIAGTPTTPVANGNLQLRNFVAGGLKFEPLLQGQVSAAPGQGVNLRLAGDSDRIQVALGADYRPVSFDIKRGEAIASGSRQGELLLVNAKQFPISLIKNLAPLPASIAAQPISGDLSGDLTVNLNTYGISGTVAIAKPIIGSLRGDSFTGTLQYANGVAELKDGKFIQGNNQYLLSANVTQTANGPQFQAKLDVPQGDIQSVLTALQIFDISDLTRGINAPTYGKADTVTNVTAGLPEATLQNQLRRLSEIETLLQQRQERENASPLPPLTAAKGQFNGTVSVVGSLTSGIKAEFNVQGQDWQWGPYSANQVIARGNFENGILTLLPLRFQSGESFASYSGTLGGDTQSGQLQLNQVPIEQVQTFLTKVSDVPPNLVGFTGFLNSTATLSGSIKNPQARGVVTLTDATLNRTNVQEALGSFSYSDARLNFGSTLRLADATNPLSIDGSIPYKLPVATVAPASDKLNLNINVQNDGLALLNLFTGGQVSWVDGTGNVQVEVSGTLNQKTNRPEQLVAKGSAVVSNATIQATALPEPLTNVEGQVQFNFDDIIVEKLTGQYSGGVVTATGTLPISQGASPDKQIALNIGELGINLKGLYKGGVRGDVAIAGTALSPRIGGEVTLFNGEVALGEQAATTGGGGTTGGEGIGGDSNSTNRIEFNNLKLTLDKNIQITRAPLLNFLADGSLTINGALGDLRPSGTIALKRGQVNLFTTQFRLARGYENTARFVPGQGLDPILNVRLAASVSESTQRRLPNDPLSAEISDTLVTTGIGSIQTVRIEARVEGPASQLEDNLELTSSPARTKTEIVALLGGSFVDTLGRGDTTLGLVNLAGSALLSNFQGIIGDALGLSEFRIFPTIISDEKRRNSTLGLSAEAGVDIGRKLSVSVSKELTTDQPFQYGLRYRINEKTLLRGSTDFSGDSRAEVQYETRF